MRIALLVPSHGDLRMTINLLGVIVLVLGLGFAAFLDLFDPDI